LRGVGVSLGNYLRTIDLPYQHLRAECHDITPISGLNTHRTLFSPQHIGYQVRGSNADQMESHSFPRKASSWLVYLESEHVDKHNDFFASNGTFLVLSISIRPLRAQIALLHKKPNAP
jgi:hypothetical protein